MRFLILITLFLSSSLSHAQMIEGRVLDFSNKEPIPYATITYGNAQGIITNDEGTFSINSLKNPDIILTISSLGYKTIDIPAKNLSEGPVLLQQQSIDLDEVFLSDKRLSGKEIIEHIESNYNFKLTKKRFFFRKSSLNTVDQFDIDVDRSTIAALNQALMDSITNSVSRQHDSYLEALGDFYGNYEKQKINLIKAADLYDPASETSITDLTKRVEDIFEKNVKKDSYFKKKSGIIGTKVESDDLKNDPKEDSLALKEVQKALEEREKEIADRRKNLKASTNSDIKDLLDKTFWKEDMTFNVFEKSNKYKFEVAGFTNIDGEVAYILNFEPKGNADFKGKMYVNTVDFGVYQIDFKNVKALKRFRLFGISQADNVYNGIMIYKKDATGLYNITYMEREAGENFGIERPLTVIEKNKHVAGRRKQNELDMDIAFKMSMVSKFQLVIYENKPVNDTEYSNVEEIENFDFQKFKKYNPDFWEGYNIIEPNTAIKAFTLSEE